MTTSMKKASVSTKVPTKAVPTKAVPAGEAIKTVAKSPLKAEIKAEIKPKAKPVKKAVIQMPAPAVVSVVAATVEKAEKPKKIKMVRDSFTVPKNELNVLGDLKLRALSMKVNVKKGELLRAGIKALAAMSDAAFLDSLKAVPTLKTGRPKK
jgi:hypothetical protein